MRKTEELWRRDCVSKNKYKQHEHAISVKVLITKTPMSFRACAGYGYACVKRENAPGVPQISLSFLNGARGPYVSIIPLEKLIARAEGLNTREEIR